jgi:UDP-N-acetylmuramoylalanine--D-glutamate ligase
MIPITVFAGRTVALFGLGGSGLATARALSAGGATVVAWDDEPRRNAAAAAEGLGVANLAHVEWRRVAALVLSPGVPLTHPEPHWIVGLARGAGVEIVGDVELFFRERRARAPAMPVIAITGTNGKSTTTALAAHLLRRAGRSTDVGGNIGTPVLELGPIAPERHVVIECSSYQIDLAPTLDPTVGVHLNLTPDHLDRHGSFERYGAVKERLLAGVAEGGAAVVGVDDGPSAAMADRAERRGARVVRVSVRRPLASGVFAEGTRLFRADNGTSRVVADLAGSRTLRGAHNMQNAAAAYAAASALGLDDDTIAAGLASFPGLAHRMQPVARLGRVLFVNDSKATNADAAEKALSSYDDIFWIAGGRSKAGGIAPLAPLFPRIRHAYLIGEAAGEFAETLAGAAPVTVAATLDRAVEAAAGHAARSGASEPVVLLSPACASFDQYPNFEVRGRAFVDFVRSLPGVETI